MQEFEAKIWFENDRGNQMITLGIEADSKAEAEEILKNNLRWNITLGGD